MKKLIVFFLLKVSIISATYVVTNAHTLNCAQREALFELMLKCEPPRSYFESKLLDIQSEAQKICPKSTLEWVPSSLYQLCFLHAFFNDPEVNTMVMACLGEGWNPLVYDPDMHPLLENATRYQDIAEYFDDQSKALPNLCELFFKINHSVVNLCNRSDNNVKTMIALIISELPPFEKWPERNFPFFKSPWKYNSNSAHIFYTALTDKEFLISLINIEKKAQENNEWVLYRGYTGEGFPCTIQNDDQSSSHALSFGSTLLGGVFFSLESCALTYAKPWNSETHIFFVLPVKSKQLLQQFRVGPLHPFMQMLVDGEMFHAHTKIAANDPNDYKNKPLNGYFMKCNKHCCDPVGYILTLQNALKYEKEFRNLCRKRCYIFKTEGNLHGK